ncbi:MAG: hypothetical protein ABSF15_27575 [Candidatus Sulfotelmatobacter sp.]|jgi:hypothetical protein
MVDLILALDQKPQHSRCSPIGNTPASARFLVLNVVGIVISAGKGPAVTLTFKGTIRSDTTVE